MLDFRGLVDVLEARGELRRIKRTVDRQRELPALMEQVDRERRAYYFEHVEGARFPLVGGLLNRYEVYGWALDVPPGEPFTRDDLDARTAAARARPLPAVEVADGPVRECVLRGSEIDLGLLPVPTMFELDSGPFITGACGVTRDPTNGALHVGVYRTLVLRRDSFSANASATAALRQRAPDAGLLQVAAVLRHQEERDGTSVRGIEQQPDTRAFRRRYRAGTYSRGRREHRQRLPSRHRQHRLWPFGFGSTSRAR